MNNPIRLGLLASTFGLVTIAVGCSGPSTSSSPDSALAGTQWRLVEFQSMDDTSMRPEDPEQYTLAFGNDGRISMQLDCNRGVGPFAIEPGTDGQTGSLTIGPLAVTRAMCPPPSMDEKIARDMDFVRGYLLRDGQLALSLMADGGIYLWEPN